MTKRRLACIGGLLLTVAGTSAMAAIVASGFSIDADG